MIDINELTSEFASLIEYLLPYVTIVIVIILLSYVIRWTIGTHQTSKEEKEFSAK